MKQLKSALAILLAIVMIVAVFPASVLAEGETEPPKWDGEGQAIIGWKTLSRATGYRISIYLDTVSDETLLTTESFGRNDTQYDATDLIKSNGPGMYVAKLEALRNGTVFKYIISDLLVLQMSAVAAPTVVIGETAATVSWDAVEAATSGYKVVATLTDKASGDVIATEEFEAEAGETEVDVTDFVKDYADYETALELSATLSIVGDLTIREEEIEGTVYKVSYLNSNPSDPPAVAEQLVGILPTAEIINTEVDADVPGKLTVDYKFTEDSGAVDNTYVKTLALNLTGKSGNKTIIVDVEVNAADFEDGNIPAEGTIDVSDIIPNAAEYTWTITLVPKYIGNAAQDDSTGKVTYTIYELPAPVLVVADDASTISWAPVVASDDVANRTTFEDAGRYKIEIYVNGEKWGEIGADAIDTLKDGEGEDAAVTGFEVTISDKIAEGETKLFVVTLKNLKDGETYDPRFTEESSAQVEVYKTYQPTNVAFDVTTGAYANPPEKDDQVFLTWSEPTSSDGIDSFLITIYKTADEAQLNEEGNPITDEEGNPVTASTETPTELTVAIADVAYDDAGVARIDVSSYIDAENVADYTATVQSIGAHGNAAYTASTFGEDDGAHFDADSGITAKCDAVKSGAVATAKEAAKIEEQDGKLVLVVDLDDVNDNFAKIESAWLSNFNNGTVSYMKAVKGVIDSTAKTVTFDLSVYYFDEADTSGAVQRLPSGDWSGTVSVYSFNNALNADTEATVKATYKPYQLVILGAEDEETGEVGDPLVVDLETGEVSWADAYAYDDENAKIEESKADYYMVKLEYLDGSEWKGVKIVGGDDNAEWEKINDTDEARNVYNIADSDAEDGGMVPGRVYRVNVQAFSDKPIEYIESNPPEQVKLCKFPAVTAVTGPETPAKNPYANGRIRWSNAEYTYPAEVEWLIESYNSTAGDEATYSDKVVKNNPSNYYCNLYKLQEDYESYTNTVTALGMVADGINYVMSDPSNVVLDYRGVVPAEDITNVEFAYEAGEGGGKLTLSFALPAADENTSEYDAAMIAAIDTKNITVKIYSDTGNLLGEYAYDDETGKADVTLANDLTSGTNWMADIDAGTQLYVAICVGSVTKFVDGYATFNALDDLTAQQLKEYLIADEPGDAVKVAPLTIPARETLAVTARIATSDEYDENNDLVAAAGSVVIDTTDLQKDATVTYTIEITVPDDEGNPTTTPYTVTDPDEAFSTASKIKAGVEGTVKVTATDSSGKYAPAEIEMKAYKLKNPKFTGVDKSNGKLIDLELDPTTYAYTNDVTFANADDPATAEDATAAESNGVITITYNKEVEAHKVTTTLASIGGYDEPNEIYVIDADNVATDTTFAGLLYDFELVDGEIKTDEYGMYVEIQADTTHGFWNADNDLNAMNWTGTYKLKARLEAENGAVIPMKTVKRDRDIDWATGIVKLRLDAPPSTDTAYTLYLTTGPKANYKAVAGGYEDAELKTVTYGVNYLEVKDLKYDYDEGDEGKVTWTADPNAESYTVDVKRDDGETGWSAVQDPAATVTSNAFELTYEAGKLYKITVTATTTDANYEDSRPDVDGSIIYIYKLGSPSDASINTKTGELEFKADEYAIENAVDLTIGGAATTNVTCNYDSANDTYTLDFTNQLTKKADDVTATITSKGGDTNTVPHSTNGESYTAYILDADDTTDATTVAGRLYSFTLVSGDILKDERGYYVELQANTSDKFWSEVNDTNAMNWAGTESLRLKGAFSIEGVIQIESKKLNKNKDIDFTTGIVKMYLAHDPDPAPAEYTLTLSAGHKLDYQAVAGGYEETLAGTVTLVTAEPVTEVTIDPETGEISWGGSKAATRDVEDPDEEPAASDVTYNVVITAEGSEEAVVNETITATSYKPTWGEGGLAAGTLYTVTITVSKTGYPDSPAVSAKFFKQEIPVLVLDTEEADDGAVAPYAGTYSASNALTDVEGVELTAEVYLGDALETNGDPAEVTAPAYVNADIKAGELTTAIIHAAMFTGFKTEGDDPITYVQSDKADDLTVPAKVGQLPAIDLQTGDEVIVGAPGVTSTRDGEEPAADVTVADITNEDGTGTLVFTFEPDEGAVLGDATLELSFATTAGTTMYDAEGTVDADEGTITFAIPADTMSAIAGDVTYTATLAAFHKALNTESVATGTIKYEEPTTPDEPDQPTETIAEVETLYKGEFISRDGKVNIADTFYFKVIDEAKSREDNGYTIVISDGTREVPLTKPDIGSKRLPTEYDESGAYYIFVKNTDALATLDTEVAWTVTITAVSNVEGKGDSTSVFTEFTDSLIPPSISRVETLYYGVFKSRDNNINTANNGGATLYFKELADAKTKANGGYAITIEDAETQNSIVFGADEINARKRLPLAYDETDTYYLSVKRTALNAAIEATTITDNPANWTVTIVAQPLDAENYRPSTSVFTEFAQGIIEAADNPTSEPVNPNPGTEPAG